MVKVAVVMAVYNGAARLPDTIASILNQTEPDFELIVVDDGSRDTTAEVLQAFAASDSRVRVLHQENRGLTRALIAGCDAVRAPYIARQDCGDLSKPERLARQIAALDADPTLAFVSSATEFLGPGGELLYTTRGTGIAITPMSVIDLERPTGVIDGPSSHGAVMFRADTYRRVGGYRSEFYYGQDWDLWYRLAEAGRFQMLPDTLYTAVFELNTISSDARPEQQTLGSLSLAALRERSAGRSDAAILEKAKNIRPSTRRRSSSADALYFIGEVLRRNGNRSSTHYFLRAIRSGPFHLKSWVRLGQSLFRRRAQR
jgi:glycosyltransferase involved in cell wall biosynthesis